MIFDISAWLLNPFVLMFLAVVTGLAFGNIKFGRFNFGVSGTLFTGLLAGWLIVKYANSFTKESFYFYSAQKLIDSGVISKNFFSLFLILFVAAVGLLAAKDIKIVLKKYGLKFIVLGIIITFIGAATTYAMTLLSKAAFHIDASPYEVSGVYTGALTSSPGLAAAIETARSHATSVCDQYPEMEKHEKLRILKILDETLQPDKVPYLLDEHKTAFIKTAEGGIGIGHAVGYPFGVIIVILAVNLFPKIFKMNINDEERIFREEMNCASTVKKENTPESNFDLIAFCVTMLLGYTLGKLELDLNFLGMGNFSLGSTGGVLITALVLGYIGKIGPLNFKMNIKVLTVIRQLALAFFLAIVGLRYGFLVVDSVMGSGAYLALVSLVVGTVSLLVGFFIGRYVLKINWIMLSGALCGGMTSTPGLGAAVDAVGNDDPAAGYGATYPFALLAMVIFTIILHKLPM